MCVCVCVCVCERERERERERAVEIVCVTKIGKSYLVLTVWFLFLPFFGEKGKKKQYAN